MIDPLQTAIVVASLLLALATVGHVVLDRRPTDWLIGAMALVELALLVQLVAGIIALAGQDGVNAVTFVGYLVGALVILPAGVLWALGEPGRSGTAVLVVATLVVPFLELRLDQIWTAGS